MEWPAISGVCIAEAELFGIGIILHERIRASLGMGMMF